MERIKKIDSQKEMLYNMAIKMNDMEQKGLIKDKVKLDQFKMYFSKAVRKLIKIPGNNPLDKYLHFTANKDSYSELEALQIELEVIKAMKKEILLMGTTSN